MDLQTKSPDPGRIRIGRREQLRGDADGPRGQYTAPARRSAMPACVGPIRRRVCRYWHRIIVDMLRWRRRLARERAA